MTPEALDDLARQIASLRHRALLAPDDNDPDEFSPTAGLTPHAEEYWLLCLSALEQAASFARLACYAQRRAVAAVQGGVS